MTPIIQFKNIKKQYNDKTIINNLNLDIEKGEFLTVIGSSGSGKTTLLKMINGLILPDGGNILINQTDIKNEDLIKLRRRIGYCVQGSVLFPHMNKLEVKSAVNKWMEIVGLPNDMKVRYPSELSGGQQQRVGIARALASSPEILLMDEPFGAVDEITRKQLQKEIKEIHKKTGVTIIFITHDIYEALILGTKTLVLNHGVVQQYDTPENILNTPANQFVDQLLNIRKSIIDDDNLKE